MNAIEPVRYKFRDEAELYDTPAKARESASFKIGDVVVVFRLGKPRLMLVRKVHAWYSSSSLEWHPVYRVVAMRPDGTFSTTTKHTMRAYPGDVFHGYQAAGLIDAAGNWLGLSTADVESWKRKRSRRR